MTKTAYFQIIDPETQDVIREYPVEYIDYKHLHILFNEARQVWDEYQVVVQYESFEMTSSHTYKEQILQGF